MKYIMSLFVLQWAPLINYVHGEKVLAEASCSSSAKIHRGLQETTSDINPGNN